MTVKLFHHSRPRTIGYPFGHVNWGIDLCNVIQIRAQPDHHQNRKKPASNLLTRCEPMVPRGRVELPLSYENRILSPTSPPVQNESISLHRVQSVTYTFRSSGARVAGDTCHPIVTVQSTGQSPEGVRRTNALQPQTRTGFSIRGVSLTL